jgi:Ricin-type beta-trefoil lectin domain
MVVRNDGQLTRCPMWHDRHQRMTFARTGIRMALKRFFQSALAFTLIGMAVVLPQAPALATGEVYGPYFLVDADTFGTSSPQCIDNPNFNQNDNTTMTIYVCNGGINQQWSNETAVTNSDYWTFNESSRKCLAVHNASMAGGATVVQYTCNNGANERWTYSTNNFYIRYTMQFGSKTYWTTSTFQIRNLNSGLCLSVENGATTSGSPLVQLDCNNNVSHVWLQFSMDHVVS